MTITSTPPTWYEYDDATIQWAVWIPDTEVPDLMGITAVWPSESFDEDGNRRHSIEIDMLPDREEYERSEETGMMPLNRITITRAHAEFLVQRLQAALDYRWNGDTPGSLPAPE